MLDDDACAWCMGSYRHDANSMSRWANDIQPGQVIDHKFTPLLFHYKTTRSEL